MPIQWTPLLPRGPFDFIEFDGDLSINVIADRKWTTQRRELGLRPVSDGSFQKPSRVDVVGVYTLTPLRFSRLSPSGPFVSPQRLQTLWAQINALQKRAELGILIVPDFSIYFNMVIASISGARGDSSNKTDVTISFDSINTQSLQLVPVVTDSDTQGLGASGVSNQGVVTG